MQILIYMCLFLIYVGYLGAVMFAYGVDMGYCTIAQAELWAIYLGMKIAWRRGIYTF